MLMQQMLEFNSWVTRSDPQGYVRMRGTLYDAVQAFSLKRDSAGNVKNAKEAVEKLLQPYLHSDRIQEVQVPATVTMFPEQKKTFIVNILQLFDEEIKIA